MFKAIRTIKNGRGSKVGASAKADTVTISINRAGKRKHQISIRIGVDVMREQRWMIGDRVNTAVGEYEASPALRIARACDDSGHMLSASGKERGTCETACYKFTDFVAEKFLQRYVGTYSRPIVLDGALIVRLKENQCPNE